MLGYGSWVRSTILSDSDLLGLSFLLHTSIMHDSHAKQMIRKTQALNPKFSPSLKNLWTAEVRANTHQFL